MGSFRPIVGSLHLHRQYNFTEPLVETALKSLRHSCRSELTRQGISLPSGSFRYGRHSPGLRFIALPCAEPLPLTFWHWAGVSPYTWGFPLAETCVFVKQSLEPCHCDPREQKKLQPHPARAPLLPKLRGQFA